MNKLLYKIIVLFLVVALTIVSIVGYHKSKNRVVDETDYSVQKDTSEDFEYEAKYEFEYIEERIIFDEKVESYLAKLSNEEKVAQLFIISLEELTDDNINVQNVSDMSSAQLDKYMPGGFIYSSNNISSVYQTRKLVSDLNDYSLATNNLPIISTYEDEEVNLGDYIYTYDEYSPNELAALGINELIEEYVENRIIELDSFGFNTYSDLSVNLNNNGVNEENNFGLDPIYASEITQIFVDSLIANNYLTFVKTFPVSYQTNASIDDLAVSDMMVLQSAIDSGVQGVYMSNEICRSITESASLKVYESENSFDVLRSRLGFDSLAISYNLNPEESLNAILAGNDVIYNPKDYLETYKLILENVNNETISSTRINNSVGRIIKTKLSIE